MQIQTPLRDRNDLYRLKYIRTADMLRYISTLQVPERTYRRLFADGRVDDAVRDKIASELEGLGYRQVRFLGIGTNALVLEINDNHLLQLFPASTDEMHPLIVEDEILQPIREGHLASTGGHVKYAVYNITPEKNITLEDAFALRKSLESKGYAFNDYQDPNWRPKNIGRRRDGKTVIFDRDAVKPYPVPHAIKCKSELPQASVYPEIATGEVSGLITDADMQALSEKAPELAAPICEIVRRDGHYLKGGANREGMNPGRQYKGLDTVLGRATEAYLKSKREGGKPDYMACFK